MPGLQCFDFCCCMDMIGQLPPLTAYFVKTLVMTATYSLAKTGATRILTFDY